MRLAGLCFAALAAAKVKGGERPSKNQKGEPHGPS